MSVTRLGWTVFFVAAGLLGFELSLMRVLLVASWHHFAFLVISIALLGFGASGTALFLLRNRIRKRGENVLFALVLVTALSMPVCLGIAQHVPVEARFVPAVFWRQIGCWIVYWALLGIPFLFGAGSIGLALMIAGKNIGRIYAANLIGSAVGLMFATVAMSLVAPEWLAVWMAGLVLVGALGCERRLSIAWGVCVAVVVAQCVFDPPHIRIDPYKYGAYVRRLERQGEADRTAVTYGPRAVVEAYRGNVFHDLPFLSVGKAPPSMSVLVADGHAAGSVLDIARSKDAEVMENTLMAFPYAILEASNSAQESSSGWAPNPQVLLLGETGGTNVWLAARHQAAEIHVVQPDDNIVALLRGPLHSRGGGVLDLPGVSVAATEPRHFVEHTRRRFDLIQLVTLESSAAGSGGVGGLAEDYLITVQGIASCLECLTDDGLLVATRGIQTPPRDNLKLFATFVASLRRAGSANPERHMIIVRDYLAVCTIAKATPWTSGQIERVRRVCAAKELTPVWFPGIRSDELNQPDEMDGPAGEQGDWFHYAARQLFSRSGQQFIRSWPFSIRPATDDRPFFLDFCKLARLSELKRTFGDLWLTRTELAFLFVLFAIAIVGVVGAVLTIAPLCYLWDRPASWLCQSSRSNDRLESLSHTVTGWRYILAYFASIGLGYMLLEMTFLSRMTRWIGDPVTAAAVTIGGFLLFSGVGSLTAQRLRGEAARWIPRVIVGLIIIGIVELLVLDWLARAVGSLPQTLRCAAAFLAIAPLGYLMGFPMPAALARLDRGAQSALPWAWGVNGFASVLAAPAATAIGMSAGYSLAGGIALLLYFVPALLFAKLPTGKPADHANT